MEHLMRRKTGLQIAGGALALLAFAALSSAASAQEVGKASAVNPAATANMRTITIGASITHKERIKTEAKGSVQLLFVDKTSMTIGPNSDLTIDEYVYNPNAGSGKLAATLSKGALRFVGGQISHSGDAEIKTASAVIGIRGGVALIGMHHAYAGYGTSTVTSGGSTVTLGAGEYIDIPGGGAAPSPPSVPPPGFVLGQIQMFQSGGGQTGGVARGTASAANVARAESKATGTQGGAVAGPLTPGVQNIPPVNINSTNLNQTIQTTVQTATIPTVDTRPAVTLTGFVGGIDNLPFDGTSYQTPANGTAQIQLDPKTNRVQADFNAFSLNGNGTRFRFGSVNPKDPADSDYASYDKFGAKVAKGAYVNGIPTAGWMSTVSAAEARVLATTLGMPNLTICDCEFTRWGFWQVTALDDFGRGGVETINGTWVAGRPTTIAEVPTIGRATYTGHVVANIQNQNSQYVAAGNFSNTVDFGARSGSVSVTGLDRTNYAGTVQFMQDPRNFGGVLEGDVGNRQMGMFGSFFRGSRNPVGEMGGTVVISGRDYLGSGIFAGRTKQ
jgi:hypothetical protein